MVAHAGMREDMHGRASGAVRSFALYGDTTGETDAFGLPVRHDWAAEYRGDAAVVYGHTPVPEAVWTNNTINLDTGAVFGGSLTALRWPERELVSVEAAETYAEPSRPFLPGDGGTGDGPGGVETHDAAPSGPAVSGPPLSADGLHLADVSGRRVLTTRLRSTVTIHEDQATAALETMSRFAADPAVARVPAPTMSPSETSALEGLLEHPAEALAAYASWGVETVVVEEKHMGSRAVVVVCRDAARGGAPVRRRLRQCETGVVLTRTGRRFFEDTALETALLDRVRASIERAGWWERFETDWVLLDCELMPWSAKAQELLRQQYAAVGSAARASVPAAVAALERASARGVDVGALRGRTRERDDATARYVEAYRRYCWPVESVDDYRIVPFHVLATEGAAHVDRDHRWHMETIAELTRQDDPVLYPTAYRVVDLSDEASVSDAIAWWETLTGAGGEGAVVKPLDFVAMGRKGLVQPAVKCRGREYLRIIYGPEYTLPGNLERLRQRNLKGKRSLALREFALGIEALERFVRGSRCGACTSACSACSRWRASPWTRVSDDGPHPCPRRGAAPATASVAVARYARPTPRRARRDRRSGGPHDRPVSTRAALRGWSRGRRRREGPRSRHRPRAHGPPRERRGPRARRVAVDRSRRVRVVRADAPFARADRAWRVPPGRVPPGRVPERRHVPPERIRPARPRSENSLRIHRTVPSPTSCCGWPTGSPRCAPRPRRHSARASTGPT